MRIVDSILQKFLARELIMDYSILMEDKVKEDALIENFISEYLEGKTIRKVRFIWSDEIKSELCKALEYQIDMIISAAKAEFSTILEIWKSDILSREISVDGVYIKNLIQLDTFGVEDPDSFLDKVIKMLQKFVSDENFEHFLD
jgi:hypothetical protein